MTTKPIRKAELHSVRLDSDVWAAIKKLPVSLNQFLRKQLSGNGVFELSPEPSAAAQRRTTKAK